MLDPEAIELADLALALEDHSEDHTWWLDPSTGSIDPRFGAKLDESERADAGERGLIPIEPLPSAVAYGDMEEFVARVRDPRARHFLERAIEGRGAFRRFKDSLLEYPELRRAWFAFHDARGERRAIEWLTERRLVDDAAAEAALARRPEPTPEDVPGLLDPEGVARRVAGELRRLYRKRLERVILIGPWARGDAHPEAALGLLVVLEGSPDRWEEKRRMDRVMWRYSIRHNTVVAALPVTRADLDRRATPMLARALDEGVRIE